MVIFAIIVSTLCTFLYLFCLVFMGCRNAEEKVNISLREYFFFQVFISLGYAILINACIAIASDKQVALDQRFAIIFSGVLLFSILLFHTFSFLKKR